MRKNSLVLATLMTLSLDCAFAAQEAGIGIGQGEEVMFINGARLRCDADCQVQVLDDGSMRVSFEDAAGPQTLQLQALVKAVRVTLQSGEKWLTYELGEGLSTRFEQGRESDQAKAVLVQSRSLAQIRQDEDAAGALAADASIARRYLGRTPLGHRTQEVSVR